jgi:membrane fusion protein, multidrug efflux system
MTDAASTTGPTDAPASSNRRRVLLIVAACILVIALAWALMEYFVFSRREKTDDAYITGNQVRVSTQLSGTVVEILARNTARVEAGQVLLRLDPTDAQQNLERNAALLAQTVRQVRQLTAQSGQFDAQISARRLELRQAEADLARREPLLTEKAVAGEEVQHARMAVAVNRAALRQAQQQSQAAQALVDNIPLSQNPAVLAARTAYKEAWLAVQRTTVVAPISGYVALRSVQLGQRVMPGEPLMSIIPLQDVWLEANFKENQLRHLRIGQEARVVADVYGRDVVFHGKVIGLSAGTGAAFSLLPPQNAAGNWIKVVQRVPVKIALDAKELEEHPLRIGLSTTTTIATDDRSGPVLATTPVMQVQESTLSYQHDMGAAETAANVIIAANSGRK